jgi:hypothetical protein
MSEHRSTMTIVEYAKARNVSDEAIRKQIRNGVIRPDERGRVDLEQADAAWNRIRRSRVSVQHDDQGRRSAEAKIVAGIARLRLAKHRLEQTREQYLNRNEVSAQAIAEAHAFLAALDQIPQRYTEEFAKLTGLQPARAYELLARFTATLKEEIGDLGAEAARSAEAA